MGHFLPVGVDVVVIIVTDLCPDHQGAKQCRELPEQRGSQANIVVHRLALLLVLRLHSAIMALTSLSVSVVAMPQKRAMQFGSEGVLQPAAWAASNICWAFCLMMLS